MRTCPKCGHTIESNDSGYITPSIVQGILRGAGGAEKLGENLVAGLEANEPGTQRHAQLHNTMRGYFESVDKIRAHQQQREFDQDEQEAALMELTVRRVGSDEDFAARLRRALEKRGLLIRLLPDPSVIEGEFQKVES